MKIKNSKFKLNPIAASIALAMATQFSANLAHAGSGWGDNVDINGAPIKVQTYYANSPSGIRPDPLGGAPIDTGTALRKFVDTLPGLTEAGANNLGQYIPIATAEKWVDGNGVITNDDYYEIAVVEYTEKMHSDLAKATRLRGYVQLSTVAHPGKHIALTYPNGSPILDTNGVQVYAQDNPHYLGPTIVATRGTAVRMKYTNYLPVGGELFIPVDETIPGAGLGPDGVTKFPQNRAAVHWHGGDTPWISDGTPHQWIAPAGEAAAYAAGMGKGVSAQNVPDMADPGPGSNTLYFPNNMSGRLMFYHDHTSGLTRLNVYAGIAAGYLLVDPVEQQLATDGIIPDNVGIPLVIEDKTYVPKDIAQQDANWDTTHWGQEGDLWFPHVYETNQDPNSFDGTNPVGRWDWGPWFWPIFPAQFSLPTGVYGDVTTTPEAFMDTPVINGTAYPTLTVKPKAYRFRILNACNDRFVNLGLYTADTTVTSPTGVTGTEVKMVPAIPNATYPATWPTDGRVGGVPDPTTAGPDIIQIGNEGGLLPHPVIIKSQPVTYEQNRRSITVLNILDRGLLLGGAERADVVIDFSQYAGQTLIVYNDAPAPVPAFDPRIDYFTGDGDQTGAGGAHDTLPGYGPNTRTLMQIKVEAVPVGGIAATPYDTAALVTALPAAYGASQPKPLIPEVAYNAAFGTNDIDNLARIFTGSVNQPTFNWTPTTAGQTVVSVTLVGGGTGYRAAPTVVFTGGVDLSAAGIAAGNRAAAATATINPVTRMVTGITLTDVGSGYSSAPTITFIATNGGMGASATVKTSATQSLPILNKAIQELFDPIFGRMNATLGVELPFSSALIQTTIPLNYVDPATEIIADGETQIWKITHNGVDSHPVHFHLVNVQVINRIGWDGTVKPPSDNEFGWKETVMMNPLEDIVLAVQAKRPLAPFGMPQSVRPMDPSQPLGSTLGFTQIDPMTNNPLLVVNAIANYDNEYVWHCHILGHEENDFMRPFVFHPTVVVPDAPSLLTATNAGLLSWTDPTPLGGVDAAGVATLGNAKNEIGFKVMGSTNSGVSYVQTATVRANTISSIVAALPAVGQADYLYKVVAYNAAGDSVASNVAHLVSLPSTPTVLVANPVAATSVTLRWVDTALNETSYQVLRNGVALAAAANLAANTITFVDTTAVASTAYTYQVVAVNSAGTASSVIISVTTPALIPLAPTGLTATASAAGLPPSVRLNWVDNASNEASYVVQRKAGTAGAACTAGGTWNAVATLAANSATYTNTTVTSGSSYCYQVRATNAAGASAWNITATAVTLPISVTAPTGLAATPNAGGTQVALRWTDRATNETAYVVKVSVNGGALTTLATITRTTAQRTGTGGAVTYNAVTTLGNTYTYQVAAVNVAGAVTVSSAPVTVSVNLTVAAAPTGVAAVVGAVGSRAIRVNWTDASNNETGFTIQRSQLVGGVWSAYAIVGNVAANATTFNNTGLTTGRSYRYQVRANGVVGNSAYVVATPNPVVAR